MSKNKKKSLDSDDEVEEEQMTGLQLMREMELAQRQAQESGEGSDGLPVSLLSEESENDQEREEEFTEVRAKRGKPKPTQATTHSYSTRKTTRRNTAPTNTQTHTDNTLHTTRVTRSNSQPPDISLASGHTTQPYKATQKRTKTFTPITTPQTYASAASPAKQTQKAVEQEEESTENHKNTNEEEGQNNANLDEEVQLTLNTQPDIDAETESERGEESDHTQPAEPEEVSTGNSNTTNSSNNNNTSSDMQECSTNCKCKSEAYKNGALFLCPVPACKKHTEALASKQSCLYHVINAHGFEHTPRFLCWLNAHRFRVCTKCNMPDLCKQLKDGKHIGHCPRAKIVKNATTVPTLVQYHDQDQFLDSLSLEQIQQCYVPTFKKLRGDTVTKRYTQAMTTALTNVANTALTVQQQERGWKRVFALTKWVFHERADSKDTEDTPAHRLALYEMGKLSELHAKLLKCEEKQRVVAEKVTQPTKEKTRTYAIECVRDGDVSKAARVLTADDKLIHWNAEEAKRAIEHFSPPPQQVTIQHAQAEEETAPPTPTPPPPAIHIKTASIRAAVRKSKNSAAAGASGIRNTYIKEMLRQTPAFAATLTQVANLFAQNRIPPNVARFLNGGVVLAFSKPNSEKRRYIVPPEAFYRVFAKAVMFQESRSIYAALNPFQQALHPHGTTNIPKLVNLLIRTHPEDTVSLKFDISDAYGTVSHPAVERGLASIGQSKLIPFFRQAYSHGNALSIRGASTAHQVISRKGVLQGDSLGMVFFCAAAQSALRLAAGKLDKGGQIRAYADDILCVGRPSELREAAETLEQELANIGCKLNPAKTSLIHADERALGQARQQLQQQYASLAGPQVKHLGKECIEVLGVPLGECEAVREHLQTNMRPKLERARDAVSTLQSAQEAYLILRFSLHAQITHLLRGTPPQVLSPFLEFFDKDIIGATFRNIMLPAVPSPMSMKIACLPLACGGLGLVPSVSIAPAAFLASLADFIAYTQIDNLDIPQLVYNIHKQDISSCNQELKARLEQSGRQTNINLNTEPQQLTSIPEKSQRALSKIVHAAALQDVLDDADQPLANKLRSAQQYGAATIFNVFPTSEDLSLEHEEFRITLARATETNLNLICTNNMQCVCSKYTFSSGGSMNDDFHLETCNMLGGPTSRHDALKRRLNSELHDIGLQTLLEPRLRTSTDNTHPDILVYSNPAEYIDVSIVNVNSSSVSGASNSGNNLSNPDRCLEFSRRREAVKSTKYQALCLEVKARFIPFVMESTGALGGAARSYLKRVFVQPEPWDLTRERRRTVVERKLAVCLHQANARKIMLIADSIRTGDRALLE